MTRATPDSNILVSAIVFGGKAGELLERALSGEFELVISPEISNEVCGVLREKFLFSDEMVLNAWDRMQDACTVLQDRPPDIQAVPDDPDDDRVVATALVAAVDTIISGDRHLLKMGEYEGIKIVRLSDFLEGLSRER